MYRVYVRPVSTSTYPLHSEDAANLLLSDAIINLTVNGKSTFTFKITKNHENYHVVNLESEVDVYQEDSLTNTCIFAGRITNIVTDIYQTKTVTVESIYSMLYDTAVRAGTLGSTVGAVIQALITNHNAYVPLEYRLFAGVVDSSTTAYSITSEVDTTANIMQKMIEDLGGFFYIRKYSQYGGYVLDYRKTTFDESTQKAIEGINLMSLDVRTTQEDVYRYLLPVGDHGETISSIEPSGHDYLEVPGVSINNYRTKIQRFTLGEPPEHVSKEAMLYGDAQRFKYSMLTSNKYINASVFDLHYLDVNIPAYMMLQNVNVVAPSQSIDETLMITKMQIDINNPQKNTITFGKDTSLTLSQRVRKG